MLDLRHLPGNSIRPAADTAHALRTCSGLSDPLTCIEIHHLPVLCGDGLEQ